MRIQPSAWPYASSSAFAYFAYLDPCSGEHCNFNGIMRLRAFAYFAYGFLELGILSEFSSARFSPTHSPERPVGKFPKDAVCCSDHLSEMPS